MYKLVKPIRLPVLLAEMNRNVREPLNPPVHQRGNGLPTNAKYYSSADGLCES